MKTPVAPTKTRIEVRCANCSRKRRIERLDVTGFECAKCRMPHRLDVRRNTFVAVTPAEYQRHLRRLGLSAHPQRLPTRPAKPTPRSRETSVAHERPVRRERAVKATRTIPNRRAVRITGRYDIDKLAAKGLLLPPTPEMRADLERQGARFRKRYAVRLGNAIYKITSRLGIPTCAACQRRRIWLNRIVIWGWGR